MGDPTRPAGRAPADLARIAALVVGGIGLLVVAFLAAGAAGLGGEEPHPTPAASAPEPAPACGALRPPPVTPPRLSGPTGKVTRPRADYVATVFTSCGDFKVKLLEEEAPVAVRNFVYLARERFYDGTLWHTVIPDLVIQGGDPNAQNGVPPDDAGYVLQDRPTKDERRYTFGYVGFGNAGTPGAIGSQLFVVVHDLAGALDGKPQAANIPRTSVIFGKVPHKYFGSLQEIVQQPTSGGDAVPAFKPLRPVFVEQVTVEAVRDRRGGGRGRG